MEKLSVQLGWLKGIGFSDVDVVYKNRSFAVFTGRRPQERNLSEGQLG